jgi:Protein of unknown function (DUF5131)
LKTSDVPMSGFHDCCPFRPESISFPSNRSSVPLPYLQLPGIDWLIVGGESGRGYRYADPARMRALRDQCQERSIAFFMKQMAAPEKSDSDIPHDLFIRQFPIRPAIRPPQGNAISYSTVTAALKSMHSRQMKC